MKYTHAIVDIGAPLGDDEQGELYSQHKSLAGAQRRFGMDFEGRTGWFSHIIVELDADGEWDRSKPLERSADW